MLLSGLVSEDVFPHVCQIMRLLIADFALELFEVEVQIHMLLYVTVATTQCSDFPADVTAEFLSIDV